jgi:hypothetical protein
MAMVQCPNGHNYDGEDFNQCPFCMADINGGGQTIADTVPVNYNDNHSQNNVQDDDDDNKTVAIIRAKDGVDPVVGWLVCIEGKDKGRDYRIHTENNYIGRSEKMDISIRNDDTISRENHAVISFDTREKLFYIAPGTGRSIIRLNRKPCLGTAELAPYDVLEIGSSKFVFITLCNEHFNWWDNDLT